MAGGCCGVAGKASGRCNSSARLLWTQLAASGLKIHSHGGVEVVVAGACGVAAKEDGSDSEGAVAGGTSSLVGSGCVGHTLCQSSASGRPR